MCRDFLDSTVIPGLTSHPFGHEQIQHIDTVGHVVHVVRHVSNGHRVVHVLSHSLLALQVPSGAGYQHVEYKGVALSAGGLEKKGLEGLEELWQWAVSFKGIEFGGKWIWRSKSLAGRELLWATNLAGHKLLRAMSLTGCKLVRAMVLAGC